MSRPGGSEAAALGARIRAARTAAGLSQADIARELGLLRSAVSAIENGKRAVLALELRSLALACCADVTWLLGLPARDDGEAALAQVFARLGEKDRALVLRYARFTAAHPGE